MAKKEIYNVGLTVPFEVIARLRYLYHISALILPSQDIDFTDFTMIALHSVTHGLFSPVVELPFDDAVFYSIRVPIRLKESLMEKIEVPFPQYKYFKGFEKVSVRYGAKKPLTFNNIVRSKFVSLLTSEGTLSLLSYVLFIKSTLLILREELSQDEMDEIITFGNFPEIPGFYKSLDSAIELSFYISMAEIDPLKFAHIREKYATDKNWQESITELSKILSNYHNSREDAKKNKDPSYIPSAEKLYNENWTGGEIWGLSDIILSFPLLAGFMLGMPETYAGRYRHYQLPKNIADLVKLSYTLKNPVQSIEGLKDNIWSTFSEVQHSWLSIVNSLEPPVPTGATLDQETSKRDLV